MPIYKYVLRPESGEQTIQLPEERIFLKCANQRNEYIALWYFVSDKPIKFTPVTFRLIMTGSPVPVDGFEYDYLDTVLFGDGDFVLHVFSRELEDRWENE